MPILGPDNTKDFILVYFDATKLLQTYLLYYNISSNLKSFFPQNGEPVNGQNSYCFRTEGSGQG